MTAAPYGTWQSPIAASALAAGAHPVSGPRPVGDAIWWDELRPAEGGRYVVRCLGADGVTRDVLGPGWNARTRVHEYGGGAWTVTADGALVFAEFGDQRLYLVREPGAEPIALTPAPPQPAGWRFGELMMGPGGDEVWCVRETHAEGGAPSDVARDLAAVPLDGSAGVDVTQIRSVVAGSHFLAGARVSPDGSRLAWIAWEHPQMPWDATELRVGDLHDGVCTSWRTLLGTTTPQSVADGEAVLQPEWRDDASLYVLTDRSGFWNIHRIGVDGTGLTAVCTVEADFAGPLWRLGAGWYRVLPGGRLLTVRTLGTDVLAVLDPATGELTDIPLGDHTTVRLGAVAAGRAYLVTGGARTPEGIRTLELDAALRRVAADPAGTLREIRLGVSELPPWEYLPAGAPATFIGAEGREVHAVVYPPANPDYEAPDGELPPFVAWVHGGPTSLAMPRLSAAIAYFTSRGIGIIDVNYGGSTGYGRAYRERLRGEWGVVDVQDTVAAVRGLATAGLADGARLAIQGGSAGGWTVLSALTTTDVFACGASYFGVAELVHFAEDTHDFESRYLDSLIGSLPADRDRYVSRAPLTNVDGLSCPVLLLQGADDPIVPPSQAEMFRDALAAKQLPYAYRLYAGESHGFRKAETIIDATEAELSFYGQTLGFDPPDVAVLDIVR